MIITKNIVFLNLPKTGSSFVRKVIKEIYDKRMNKNWLLRMFYKKKYLTPLYTELLLPNIRFKYSINRPKNQHGTYIQIPEKDKNKNIIAVVRNPYRRFLSQYEFGFWKNSPILSDELLAKELPTFPDLDINQFIKYQKLIVENAYLNYKYEFNIGSASIQFIKFFFKDPDYVLKNLNKEYFVSESLFIDDIAPIKFIRQENLNNELSEFLKDKEFTEQELSFIKNHQKVNKTVRVFDRSDLLTKEVIDYIKEYESFYISVLKHFGIDYSNP